MSTLYQAPSLASIRGVSKRYGSLTALDNVSLEIAPGEIFALLGPNGAGKTTLIGCLTGLVAGFDGEIAVAGHDVVRDYRVTRRLVGLVPQELNWDAFFNVREVLEFQGGYFGVRHPQERVEGLLRSFSLLDKAGANTRWLSGGMKRRLMICKALMHEPVLLFLDEPTAGVDVELREELWEYVRELRDRGTTIVLTTHYIEEAERLADRVGILRRGRLMRVDSRASLMREFARSYVDITLAQPADAALIARLAPTEIERQGAHTLRVVLSVATGEWAGTGSGTELDAVFEQLRLAGASVVSVQTGRKSLEEIFKQLISASE